MRLVLSDTLERLIVMLVPVHQAVPVPGRS
jgi:hypothetical protein